MEAQLIGNVEETGLDDPRHRILLGAGTIMVSISAILAVATAMECHRVGVQLHQETSWTAELIYGAVLWLWWAVVAYVLWQAGRRWSGVLRLSAASVGAQVAIAVGVASIHMWLMGIMSWSTALVWGVDGPARYQAWQFFQIQRIGLDIVVYGLIWLACSAIHMQIVAQRSSMDALALKQQLTAAQLGALQMQMEPHFLLNTLNAITTLVDLGRYDEAKETLSRLNGMLQSTLERRAPIRVPLERELRLVEDYLAIERVRFADRLTVDFEVDPAALDGLVPCFLLQPIVENSIRHGIAQREEEGRIEAHVECRDHQLYMRVRDNGPGLGGKRHPGYGIGLRNTEERLRHFYQGAYAFSIREPEDGGFEVSITIPYERDMACV
jgi:signal transduction histidine kinase